MPSPKIAEPFNLPDAMLATYATNDRINHYLVDYVPAAAWREKLPGGKGRTIAAIVAHMHNVRLMWLKSAGKTAVIPEKLDGDTCSPAVAIAALTASHQALQSVISDAMNTDGRIKGFRPDVTSFLGYLIAHDAHHRGQISMLARQLGHPLSQSAMFGMWEWGTR